MNQYQELYKKKQMSAEQALELIQDGDSMFSAQAAAEPQAILSKLQHLKETGVKGTTLNSCLPIQYYDAMKDPEMAGIMSHNGWFFTAGLRDAQKKKLVSAVPQSSTSVLRKSLQRLHKKDITSYTRKRKLGDSCEYGEAFSYVKCKTNNAALWGETVDFGESVRFTFGKEFNLKPTELYQLMDRITHELAKAPAVTIPRYHKVLDKDVLAYLEYEFNIHMLDFLTDVDVEDYWLTGVSFSFTNDYRYSLRFRQCDLTAILDSLDANTVRKAVEDHAEQIGDRHDAYKHHPVR